MKRIGHYSPEVRERAVRLVQEQERAHSSQWAAITSISEKVGCTAEMLSPPEVGYPARPTNPARVRWAVLIARTYEVLPLLCPACGGPMRIVSLITDPPVVVAILQHLELPHTPPPISPARGPPQGDFLLDQTPAFDPSEAEPVPVFVFDQSLPHEFDD
jgi:hypothetical protein